MIIIYNCKKCKIAKRVEYLEKSGSGRLGRRDASGKWFPAGAYVTAIGGGKPTEYGGDPFGICSQCGKLMDQGELSGRIVPDVPCDKRCTGARGHSCDCSCGGKNHGQDWD